MENAKFENTSYREALSWMSAGAVAKRKTWNYSYVFMTKPQEYGIESIPTAPVPTSARFLALCKTGRLHMQSHMLRFDTRSGEALLWFPSKKDMLANDWHIIF